ncbi:MAG: N-acetylglucosamine-6-phosphate deacetylase, partial [Bacteroidota bacterium]
LVVQLLPVDELSSAIDLKNFGSSILAPACIDAQVYGAGDLLFSLHPTVQTLQTMYETFATTGTCLFQPTIATNTISVFKNCIDAVKRYWAGGGKGVHGLHLEGPWLNPQKAGAHVKEWMHTPTVEEVGDLLAYGKDAITMITLAPEMCSSEIIALLRKNNIVISAGHSNATYQQAMQSFDEGIGTVTHLYNAMSGLQHRAPGLVGAAFQNQTVMSSVIPDGHHVDYAAIAIAKKIMGERLFAITDAVTTTSEGPYRHEAVGDKYECNGTLSGSALSMHTAFLNLVNEVGIEEDEALRMCAVYPARALGIDDAHGKIATGYAAEFVCMSDTYNNPKLVTETTGW